MITALTIAGSDPTGGAGLQADLKVFAAMGVHGMAVPSALTVQDTRKVYESFAIDPVQVRKQLICLLDDIRPDALKTGMLYSLEVVEIVANAVRAHKLTNLVIDPVTVSSSGARLVQDGVLEAMERLLYPITTIATPNIYEASVITGINIRGIDDMKEAALELLKMGMQAVVVTGGHLDKVAIDVYCDSSGIELIEAPKVHGEFHGTGCAFSAALAAALALGQRPLEATRTAKVLVHGAITNADHPGRGMGILVPQRMN